MQTPWQRKRDPDAVPTPVAVALSDFCRRAKSPAAAPEVRAALALLSEEEDFRLQSLAERDPEATPLGPYAVIDVLHGTAPTLAAQRQAVGYYELAQSLVDALTVQPERRLEAPESKAQPTAELPVAIVPSAPEETSRKRKTKEPAPTVSERIAPKKREPVAAQAAEPELPPKRELPKGRGRFTRLSVQKLASDQLLLASAHDHLSALIDQHPHRFSLQSALSAEYASPRSEGLALADLEAALTKHGLLDRLVAKERELILSAYTEHRGAIGRVSWALGVRPPELDKLVALNALGPEVEEVRERFRREALSPKNLASRIDLLGRHRYLEDLGIERKFREALSRDLSQMLEPLAASSPSLTALAERAGREYAVEGELIARAVEKLGLSENLKRRLLGAVANP
jgi:hypothetical protein